MNEIQQLFNHMREKPRKLAPFLHTLSFLEYIGSRKIMKSQHESTMSLEVLGHVSEEVRHARVFKKLAEEVGGRQLGGYIAEDLLCMSEAEAYFQAVDAEVGNRATDPAVAYALTTLLVEERALELYPELEQLLASKGYPGRVAGILKEEEGHLRAIRQETVGYDGELECCRAVEKASFSKWVAAIQSEIE
jgi:hypothetical protein